MTVSPPSTHTLNIHLVHIVLPYCSFPCPWYTPPRSSATAHSPRDSRPRNPRASRFPGPRVSPRDSLLRSRRCSPRASRRDSRPASRPGSPVARSVVSLGEFCISDISILLFSSPLPRLPTFAFFPQPNFFQPTRQPTTQPSRDPTRQPSSQPSRQPTRQPSSQPTLQPSAQPSRQV